MFKMNYFFEKTDWIENSGQDQSHINFEVFSGDGDSHARDYPDQRSYNKEYFLGQSEGGAFGDSAWKFDSGEQY